MIQKYLDKLKEIYDSRGKLYSPNMKSSNTYYRLSMGIEPFSEDEKKLIALSKEFDCIYESAIKKANNSQFKKVDEKIKCLIATKLKIEKQISVIDWEKET